MTRPAGEGVLAPRGLGSENDWSRRPADVSAWVVGSTDPPIRGLPGVWAWSRICEDGDRRQGEGGCRHQDRREDGTGSANLHGCAPVRPNPWREEATPW